MTTYNDMQSIKRRLFAMRNGAMADSLRRFGANYRIIFGVNLPQLIEIALDYAPDADLASRLWANTSTRESLLLAPMIFPREQMTFALASQWISQVPTPEVADILCHRLLRHLPEAYSLVERFIDSPEPLIRYTALRLQFNLLPQHLRYASSIATAELERSCPLTASLCRNLLDEVSFLSQTE